MFNMPLGIEQHCEWIYDCIEYMDQRGLGSIEADVAHEQQWIEHVKEVADMTLLPTANSWYLGGGKRYKEICDDIAAKGYEGFRFEPVTSPGN